jgi:TonB-dependent starch-binding outer membrane protein SusC
LNFKHLKTLFLIHYKFMKKNNEFFSGVFIIPWKGIFKIMKVIILLLTTTLASFAVETYSQSKNLTFRLEDATLLEFFQQIEKQSDMLVAYDISNINLEKKISISVDNTSIENALKIVLADTDLSYRIVNRYIIIKKGNDDVSSFAQPQKTVTGKVSDAEGLFLPGVSVIIKGTNIGTTTDGKGSYSLHNVPENAVLIFSFVGMKSQEINVAGKTTINVSFIEEAVAIGEVVAVGYGTQKRSDVTGSIASVKSDDMKNFSAQNLNEAIQGRVSGIYVTKGSGSPGSGADIIIRGATSINGLSPLYIVDGVRMGTEANFNLKDVESIEILKDAGSAAIYGAQAAGGVILVTTKRGGSDDKMKVDFSANYGSRTPINLYKLLNTTDFIKAKEAAGWSYSSWSNPSSLPNTDWVDELFKDGSKQEYNLSLSGGNKKVNYFTSANYMKEDGVRIDNWFERFGLRSNIDYKINDRVKIGETLYAWKTKENPAENGGIPFRSVPTMSVYDSSNEYGGWGQQPSEGYYEGSNPVAQELITHHDYNQYALEASVYGEFVITKGLTFKTTLAATLGSLNQSTYVEAYDYGSLSKLEATYSKYFYDYDSYMANFVLSYSKSFGKHNFKADVVYEALKSSDTYLYGETSGFTVTDAESFFLSTTSYTSRTAYGSIGKGRGLSQVGRLNYNYGGKYYFTGTVRRDGSDKFGSDNRWGIFPAFNLAWRASEENFLKDNPAISNFKIRSGYGILGSDNLAQFLNQSSYSSLNAHSFDGSTTSTGWGISKFGNSAIKWEEVHSIDMGADLGLFNNHLNFTVDWYNRNTVDMIYSLSIPPSSGIGYHNSDATDVYVNLGKIRNRGLEFSIEYENSINDFKFSVGANASFNKNKVIKITDDESTAIITGTAGDTWNSSICKTIVGEPMSQYWGYKVDGIFASDDEVKTLNSAAPSGTYQSAQTGAGDLKYKDLNGDKEIDEKDKTYIGNPWPKMIYGFSIKAEYKGFDLTMLFQGVYGIDVYNGSKAYTQNFYGDYNTTSDVFGASSFNGNGITGQPRLGFTSGSSYVRDPNGNFKNVSSYFVEDGSYLKLRNLQIGYNLPKALLNQIKIASARVYFSGQNLLTFTKYSGADPEVGGDVTSRGLDNIGIYPQSRLFSIGIDLSLK